MLYRLEGRTPVFCSPNDPRFHTPVKVAKTERGGVLVSTVFLGIDHGFGEGPPLVFETMIFGGEHDEWCARYATWGDAEEGHKQACQIAFGSPRSRYERDPV